MDQDGQVPAEAVADHVFGVCSQMMAMSPDRIFGADTRPKCDRPSVLFGLTQDGTTPDDRNVHDNTSLAGRVATAGGTEPDHSGGSECRELTKVGLATRLTSTVPSTREPPGP